MLVDNYYQLNEYTLMSLRNQVVLVSQNIHILMILLLTILLELYSRHDIEKAD